jgi:hypothetical protein
MVNKLRVYIKQFNYLSRELKISDNKEALAIWGNLKAVTTFGADSQCGMRGMYVPYASN